MELVFNRQAQEEKPCIASVSYSEADGFGAMWESEHRGLTAFGPKGIAYRPCEGDNLMLMPVEGTNICLGVQVGTRGLNPGELMLTSVGGAKIHLRKDGSITLNGLEIDKSGRILNGYAD